MMAEQFTQKATAIETEVGFISGRDAIYLHKINSITDSEVTFSGELNGYNCSKIDRDIDVPFSLTFKGILMWQAVELDFAERIFNIETDSCFDLIEYSEKIAKITALDIEASVGKINRGYDKNEKFSNEIWHQHFVLSTYDTVFEIIAQSYTLTLNAADLKFS